jgi:hypothetical protein
MGNLNMARYLAVLLTLLDIPALVCGCAAGTAEPAKAVTIQVEPHATEPVVAEPNETEPVHVEPPESKPIEAKPATRTASKPAAVEPNEQKPDSATPFHNKCAEIFKSFVDSRGMVNYKELRRKRLELRAVLDQYDNPDRKEYESWPREDKIAFWINVYNLQKLSIVADNYPIEPSSRILTIYWGPSSIRHIEEKITRHKFLVMDEEFTFSRIEKRFFRGEFDDPRVFFALSSACLSSPPLRNEPYCGRRLNEQLDDQARRFLFSPLALRIDREKQRVYLSALFQQSSYGKEFAEKFAIDRKFKDFPAATRAVLNFITNYVSKQSVSFLETGNYTIEYMTYDWTINDGS